MITREIEEQLIKYLTDAHAMEEQALVRFENAPRVAEIPELAETLDAHLEQTQRHKLLIRDRLRAHGTVPSSTEGTVARAATRLSGFTHDREGAPSKLAGHAYCYKHLELAVYDLLECVAQRAQDTQTAQVARRIGWEEQAIADRLAELFDTTVDAALAQQRGADLQSNLVERIADAHATEEESVALLGSACEIVARGRLRHIFEDHLAQSELHRRLMEHCLEAHGAKRSAIKVAATRSSPRNWAPSLQAQPDSVGGLVAFVFAFEHLEIASYQQLIHVAARAGHEDTLGAAQCILIDEQTAVAALRRCFDAALVASPDDAAVLRRARGVSIDALSEGPEHP